MDAKDDNKKEKDFGKAQVKARFPVSVGRRRILALPAQGEQQRRKMQPTEIDQAIICNTDRNKRHKRHKDCILWEREFEIRRPTDGAGSTETLFALIDCKFNATCRDNDEHTIGLYSPRERCGYRLPPIPDHPTGIPLQCQCVSLGGKLYIMGGDSEESDSSESDNIGSDKVYAINVKGDNMQWKRCPSMIHPRVQFGVGVLEGKIYVFGGFSMDNCTRTCEVYDPTVGANGAWTLIKQMPSARHSHSVIAVGKELYIHGGEVLGLYELDGEDGPPDSHDGSVREAEDGLTDPDGKNDDEAEHGLTDLHGSSDEEAEAEIFDSSGSTDDDADSGPEPDPTLLEAYNAVHDNWRVVEHWMKKSSDAVFVAEERVYAMDKWNIFRLETRNWVHFADCPITTSGYGFGPELSVDAVVHPFATEALDGIRERGLVALVSWYNMSTGLNGQAVMQSDEFFEGSLIEWELIANYSRYVPLSSVVVSNPFLCRVDL